MNISTANHVITRQIQNSNIPFKYQVNLPWNTPVGLPKAFQRKTNWKYWIKYIKPIWCPQHRPFVRGFHRWHKGLWRGALMLSLVCAWLNGWVNNRDAGDLRCHRAHYDVIVMFVEYNDSWFCSHFIEVQRCRFLLTIEKCENGLVTIRVAYILLTYQGTFS